ncbi:MAG: hypothetical protein KDL87_15910, partial [Verrucomicrobiae bacterium]|nr:hypothetical protein [Verrucomicrobiae bacterium]
MKTQILPLCLLACASLATAQDESQKPQYDDGSIVVPAARADESILPAFSSAAAEHHLRDGALAWSESKSCISCHTNGAYLTMRPALTPWLGRPENRLREFALAELAKLKNTDPDMLQKGTRPAQAIYIAAGLAEWDRHVTKTLSPETREALEFMFSLQQDTGSWASLDCWPPYESDAYHLATVAAMAAGTAPDWLESARSERVAAGLEKLKRYLTSTEPPHDYGRTLLLWASCRFPGLLDEAGKASI